MISYQKENIKIETRYQVEYAEREDEKIKSFPSLDEALSFYLVMFFRMCSTNDPDRIDNVRLFEQIVLDGEVVRESWIEPRNTMLYYLRLTFHDESIRAANDLRESADEYAKENEKYKAFIKQSNLSTQKKTSKTSFIKVNFCYSAWLVVIGRQHIKEDLQ